MVINFVTYKLCKLVVCLTYFQKFSVCKPFPKFTSFLLRPLRSVKEGFYCIWSKIYVMWRWKVRTEWGRLAKEKEMRSGTWNLT
jgi:hypothetical protein